MLGKVAAEVQSVSWVKTDLPGGAGTYYFASEPDAVRAEIREIVAFIVDTINREYTP
jgi:hypothetical protein